MEDYNIVIYFGVVMIADQLLSTLFVTFVWWYVTDISPVIYLLRLWGSSVIIVTRLWAGWPGFNSWQGQGYFLFATGSRLALGLTQLPIQWVLGSLSLGVKQQGCEADHSHLCSAKVKSVWNYTSTPPHIFMAWCLVKYSINGVIFYNVLFFRNLNCTMPNSFNILGN
jgi:hypothetical protein